MRRTAQALSALIALSAAGCQTIGHSALTRQARSETDKPAVATFSYSGGRAVQIFPQPISTVQQATLASFEDLRIGSVRPTNDGGAIVLQGTTADNRSASVVLRPNHTGTRVSARFGLFGDQPLSLALMDRIGVRLGNLPPSAVPVDPPSEPGKNPYFSRGAVSDEVMLKDQADAAFRGNGLP